MLIRELIESKERHIRRYEQLKHRIVAVNDSQGRRFRDSKISRLPDAGTVNPRGQAATKKGQYRKARPSLADFTLEKETKPQHTGQLMSLFDQLIKEVDTPVYQIGLLSRYRIRSHIYRARSVEISEVHRLRGETAINEVVHIPKSSWSKHTTSPANRESHAYLRERSVLPYLDQADPFAYQLDYLHLLHPPRRSQ